MVAEQTRQDQLSNDLANASTPGYKPDESPQHNFGAVLLANTHGASTVGSVDQGVALGKSYTDLTPTSIQETGEPLDFAIEGAGFFAVRTAQGVRYTRDGQFTSSAAGVLTDAQREPVLSQSGAQIKVPAAGHAVRERARRLRTVRRRKAGRKPLYGQPHRQGLRGSPAGRAGGIRRRRREGHDRDDHLAAELPVRSAGDPGDRADAAGGLHAGRLDERRRVAARGTAARNLPPACTRRSSPPSGCRSPEGKARIAGRDPARPRSAPRTRSDGNELMLEGLYSAAAGMSAQQLQLDAISNDLANLSTNGYKSERVAFSDLLYNKVNIAGTETTAGAGASAQLIGRSRDAGGAQGNRQSARPGDRRQRLLPGHAAPTAPRR